jgi:hypothetical protein
MRRVWKRRPFTTHHSIPPPLAVTLAWLFFNCFSLWLSSDIQARKELLDQARIFKAIWLQVCFFFAIHEIRSSYEINISW